MFKSDRKNLNTIPNMASDNVRSSLFFLRMSISRQDWLEASNRLKTLLRAMGVDGKLPPPQTQHCLPEEENEQADEFDSDEY